MFKERTYIIFIGVLFAIFLIVQALKPASTDWRPSYSRLHSKPLGNMATYEVLPAIFPGKKMEVLRVSPFEYFPEKQGTFNYILVTGNLALTEEDIDVLMEKIEEGNNAFIAAHTFGELGDQLEISAYSNGGEYNVSTDSFNINFVNSALRKPGGYWFRDVTKGNEIFLGMNNKDHVTVLGTGAGHQPNFIKIRYGKGNLYLHSAPKVFTNYGLLNGNENFEYLAHALSYLPVEDVVWDEYYNTGRGEKMSDIRLILNHKTLRYAWFTTLVLTLVFFLFQGKRRQKRVKVVKPVTNTTMEFVETVGRLYYNQKDYKDLIRKQVAYFLSSVRDRFYLDTNRQDYAFLEQLSRKSGVPVTEIKPIFDIYERVNYTSQAGEKDIIEMNRYIESFNQKSKR